MFGFIEKCFSRLMNQCYYNHRLLALDTTAEELTDLLEIRGVNPNYHKSGFNALHATALTPRVDVYKRFELLLSKGVNVNSQIQKKADFFNTPLHLLIANEQTEIAIYYIDKARALRRCIHFNARDSRGATPLVLASQLRLTKLALHLLQQITHGFAVNLDAQNQEGMTALHYACALGQMELIQQLLAYGADVGIANKARELPRQTADYKESVVRKMLLAVEVEPDRDEKARLNLFYDKNFQTLIAMANYKRVNLKLVLVAEKKVAKGSFPLPIQIPAKKENQKAIENMLDYELIDSTQAMLQKKIVAMPPSGKEFIRNQYRCFTGRSLISACLAGQAAVREYGLAHMEIPRTKSAAYLVPLPLSPTLTFSNRYSFYHCEDVDNASTNNNDQLNSVNHSKSQNLDLKHRGYDLIRDSIWVLTDSRKKHKSSSTARTVHRNQQRNL
jgi:ankyrin repeat protein